MVSSLIRKYHVIICHFDVVTPNNVESLHCFFAFEWIQLKFGVMGNFGLLISDLKGNLRSKSKLSSNERA